MGILGGAGGTGVRIATASVRTGFAMTGSVTGGAVRRAVGDAGPYGGYKGCNGRATARVAPTKALVGADDPVRPVPVTQHFVGQGPCALPWVRGERNPPVTALPCQPPLGKGAKGTGDADCHSQCAHWLRNDREFYRGCGVRAVGDAGPYGSVTWGAVQNRRAG